MNIRLNGVQHRRAAPASGPGRKTNGARLRHGILESGACATLAAFGLLAAGPAAAADPIAIPLAFMYAEDEQGVEQSTIVRLTIQIGVNGAAARTYMFDTGSSALVGQVTAKDPDSELGIAAYGNGTYGNLVQWVTPGSLDYTTANGVAGHFGGSPAAQNSLTRVVLEGFATYNEMKAVCDNTPDKCDLDSEPIFKDSVKDDDNNVVERVWWAVKSSRLAVEAGTPAEDDGTYGTFGAGNFLDKEDKYSALGASTTSGYVISANANLTKGEAFTPGCAPCVTLNLNASFRAQFDTLVPWNVTHDPDSEFENFPGSGANASTQFEGNYSYTFKFKDSEGVEKTATLSGPALLDTGTPNAIFLTQSDAIEALKAQGLDIAEDKEVAILSMTMTGGGEPITISDPVLSRQSGEDKGNALVVGLPFFLQASVMYDLQNKVTGYTSYFVSTDNFTTDSSGNGGPHLGSVTAAMGNQVTDDGQKSGKLGLAGTISGSGGLTIGSGADVRMSGVNSYTGTTVIENGAQLHLAGPGSIAQSSTVVVDGWLDLSLHGAANPLWGVEGTDEVSIRSLAGSGEVSLFDKTLVLTHAGGDFAGILSDMASNDQSMGGKLSVLGGTQTLSGKNIFTGLTTVGPGARLLLTQSGSIAGEMAVHGVFGNDGHVSAPTNVYSGGTLAGSGALGDVTVANGGALAPGSPINAAQKIATLTIDGDLVQQAGSTYVVDVAGGLHDSVAVTGSALIENGAKLAFAPDAKLGIGKTYEVLAAADGVTGSYDLTPARISAFVAPAQLLTAYSLSVTAFQDRALADAALTGNQIGVAIAADALSLDHRVRGELLYLGSDADARRAFDSLSGDSIASIRGALLDDSAYLSRGILRRANGGIDAVELAEDSPTAMWMEAETRHMQVDSDGDFNSIRFRTSGFRLGIDRRFGDVAVGVAFGHGWSKLHTTDRSNEATAKGLHLGLYGLADFAGAKLTGGWTWSRYKVSGDRIADYGEISESLDSRWTGKANRLFAELGRAFGKPELQIEPFVGLSHAWLTAEGFGETGGDAALQVARDKSQLTTLRLGARGQASFEGARLKLGAAWEQNSGDRESRIEASFSPGGDGFVATGLTLPRHLASVEVGLGFAPVANGWLGVDYGGRFASRFQDHRGRLSFDYRF